MFPQLQEKKNLDGEIKTYRTFRSKIDMMTENSKINLTIAFSKISFNEMFKIFV